MTKPLEEAEERVRGVGGQEMSKRGGEPVASVGGEEGV